MKKPKHMEILSRMVIYTWWKMMKLGYENERENELWYKYARKL